MHGDNGTNDVREINNSTDVNNSILYTILMNDFATVSSSTGMASAVYNESTSTTTYVDLAQDQSESGQRLWNLSRTAVTSLSESTTVPFNVTRSTTAYTSSTTDSYDEFGPPEGVEYIFVPLGVVVSVIILSAVVWVAISLLSLLVTFSPGQFFVVRVAALCQDHTSMRHALLTLGQSGPPVSTLSALTKTISYRHSNAMSV